MNARWVIVLATVAMATFYVPAQAQFAKQGVRLLSNIPLAGFQGNPSTGADCYGYTSASGREYALMQVRTGTAVVEITDPFNPAIIAHITGLTSLWHQITVVGNFAYAVADSVVQGMQVIDLSQVDSGIVTLVTTYTGNSLANVHTIQNAATSNCVILNGSNLANGGLVAIDISNPAVPVQLGVWNTRYVHDCQIIKFTSGPNAGKEIAFACCGNGGLYIIDVTNKAAMTTLSNFDYFPAGSNYTHSGQLTEDGKYFLINDEFDESNALVPKCSTHIFDVSNLSAPVYKGFFTNNGTYIDHNSHIRDGFMYLSAYRGGMRVYDVRNPLAIAELGWIDTYPEGDGNSFTGDWGVYAGFPSGNVILSDINRGLFVVDPSEAIGLGAPLTGASVVVGSYISGTIKDLRKPDDLKYVARYQASPTSDLLPEIRVQVDAVTSVTPSTFLDLTIESRVAGPLSATGTLQFWNWVTGQFDLAGTIPITPVDAQQTINGLDGTKYVNVSGQIRMRLRVMPGPDLDLIAYNLHLDMVKFSVRRAAGRSIRIK